jgi:hypothetical protein
VLIKYNVNINKMLMQTINDILSTFCLKMGANLNSVIIKRIDYDDDTYTYNVLLKLNDELYSIKHYEPIIMKQDVNYGAVPFH